MAMPITTDDSMSDDVFEESDVEKSNFIKKQSFGGNGHVMAEKALSVTKPAKALVEQHTPSPTGYPGYKPPKEALRMYAYENEYFEESNDSHPTNTSNAVDDNDAGDGWKSFHIEEDSSFDENVIHKV